MCEASGLVAISGRDHLAVVSLLWHPIAQAVKAQRLSWLGTIMTEEASTYHSTSPMVPAAACSSPLSEATVRRLICEEVAAAVAVALVTPPRKQQERGYILSMLNIRVTSGCDCKGGWSLAGKARDEPSGDTLA